MRAIVFRQLFRVPLLLIAAVTLLCSACQRGAVPPDLASFGNLDPAVSALLSEQLAALRVTPSDADNWGRLAMALEANGLTPQARDPRVA